MEQTVLRFLKVIGTWRDVWRRERPDEPMPDECPLDWTPHGATYANLQAAAKVNPNYYFNIFTNRQQDLRKD